METFSPGSAFSGGLLIGLAATLLLVLNGRAAGVSGIVGGALIGWKGDLAWRVAFVIGLIVGPLLYAAVLGAPSITVETGLLGLIVAGFLVGFGTQLGGGCTSGHGVCGISRGSVRSITATIVFMAAAMVTVYVMRHVVGS
jgi:uncharacterized membrane protein YedE/YeeE